MRVGVVLSKPPYPLDEGTNIAHYNEMRGLHLYGHKLTLFTLVQQPQRYEVPTAVSQLCEDVVLWQRPMRVIGAVRRPTLPISVAARFAEEDKTNLVAEVDRRAIGVLLVESPPMEASIPRQLYETTTVVLRTNDLSYKMYANVSKELPYGFRRAAYWLEGLRLRRYQLRVNQTGLFDANVFSRRDDMEFMRRLFPRNARKYVYVPLPVDVASFSRHRGAQTRASTAAECGAKVVLFTGAMSYLPNVTAVVRFTRDIWPRVRSRVAGATFVVAGKDPVPQIRHLSKTDATIVVTGTLSQAGMAEWFEAADLVVIPVTSGAGYRYKAVEALAAGKIVVSTPFAIEGLELEPGKHLITAKDDAGFADACVDVLRAPGKYRCLAEAGSDFVIRNYSVEAVSGRLERILQGLVLCGEMRRQCAKENSDGDL